MAEAAFDRLKSALADRYTIERELGSGGMATVYLAEDLKHHRKVAVKVLRPDLAAALGPERFLQEIEIAAQLQHPNILPLYDSGRAVRRYGGTAVEEQGEFLYYVMPYVEGPSLRDKLAKEGELPIAEAVRILRDVVDALSEAHSHGVIHRDIKPENILLRGRHALVTDFGVAKAVSEATGREKLTTAGVALGTPAYMAPEQASADPHLDQRVDIYAVGAVAYELLTGRPVFMGTTPQMILSAHMTEPPQPVTKHRDTVPAALESVVMRCLEKRPADRWQSAEELLPQLEALATPSGGVTPTDTRPMPATAVKRRWAVPGILAVAVMLIVVGVLLSKVLAPNPIAITTSNIRAVTSEPGIEWQPALSPDGSRVAFVAPRSGRQSIVIRSRRGIGGAAELVAAQAEDGGSIFYPDWSPDGEFLRFWNCPPGLPGSQEGCTWQGVATLGGQARLIDLPGHATSVAWSPDGSRVAFVKDYAADSIFMYSTVDRETTLLAVQGTPGVLFSLTWSPDGSRIAFVNGNPFWEYGIGAALSSIWMVGANGGEPVRVTDEDFLNVSPVWLDEDHLLFISNREGLREIYVVEVGPTGPRGEPRRVPGATDARSISYSTEGRTLAFSKATARQNIRSYRFGSGSAFTHEGIPVTRENAIVDNHDISPDGEWIVYSSNLRGNSDIYTKRPEGGSAVPIVEGPLQERAPRWSPDGTEIAFNRFDGDSWAVMVVFAEGGVPQEICKGESPTWSPSGLEIAFSPGGGRYGVSVVSRDTVGGVWGEPAQLTDSGFIPADWVPDNSGLLCIQPWPSTEMVVLSREAEVLWRYDLADVGIRWGGSVPRFSRDGSAIYVQGGNESGSRGVWAIPVQGGEPSLMVAGTVELPTAMFSVGPDRLYVTVGEHEVDIWVMDVEVGR